MVQTDRCVHLGLLGSIYCSCSAGVLHNHIYVPPPLACPAGQVTPSQLLSTALPQVELAAPDSRPGPAPVPVGNGGAAEAGAEHNHGHDDGDASCDDGNGTRSGSDTHMVSVTTAAGGHCYIAYTVFKLRCTRLLACNPHDSRVSVVVVEWGVV